MRFLAKSVLLKAKRGHYAIPAFNVSTLEQIRTIVDTAAVLRSPIILETSEGESELMTYHETAAIVASWRAATTIPIILNADHHHSFARVKEAIDAGYNYVHIDASAKPDSENIALTRRVVRYAHARGVLVEGELGAIGGSSERHHQKAVIQAAALTPPDAAAKFVSATGIDTLAANIGNIHGLWHGGKPHLAIDRLRAIAEATDVFLTLHGGSGISDVDVQRAIRAGITKVNMNTELRVAFIGGLRKVFRDRPTETTPYKLYPVAMAAVTKVVQKKIKLCRSRGRA